MIKYFVIIAFLLATFLGIPPALAEKETAQLKAKGNPSEEFMALSHLLSALQQRLQERFGIEKIYISGGSARTLLDHVYFSKPLEMRDLDICIVAHKKVERAFADRIGRELESPLLGKYNPADLHSNTYSNPKLSPPQRYHYTAGENLFLRWQNGGYLDLAIFHQPSDLELNGLFDIETIMIPLDANKSLDSFYKHLKSIPYDELVRTGEISDRYQGYSNWLKKEAVLVHWTDIEAEPVLRSLRVLLSYAKLGKNYFPSEVAKRLSTYIENAPPVERLSFMGNLVKLMSTADPVSLLSELNSIGALRKWSPDVAEFISRTSANTVQQALNSALPIEGGNLPGKNLGRLVNLIEISIKGAPNHPLRKQLIDLDPTAKFPWKIKCHLEKLAIDNRYFGINSVRFVLFLLATNSFAKANETHGFVATHYFIV